MNIAISTSVIQRGKTGVAQYVFALVRALSPYANEHRVDLLVLEEDVPLFQFAAHNMRIVPIAERYRDPIKNIAWHNFILPAWLKKEGVDVCHVPSYRRMLGSAPCALVATIHDLAQFHVPRKYDMARMLYARVVARQLAQRQDQIIAISQNTAKDIETIFRIPQQRIHVIYNGLDHERFVPEELTEARQAVATKCGISKPFVLYVSRIEHPAKNHVRLIEAFDRFRSSGCADCELVLVGSDWHGADVVHARARQSPYVNDIRFLGFVDDGALPALYSAAEAMVYPSLFEGFGLPPVEAMACGCPVLSSKAGSLGEVVGDSAGTIEPEDVQQIADGLARITTDKAWREELRTAGLLNAQRFNWRTNAHEVMNVYDVAADQKSSSRSWIRVAKQLIATR